MDWSKEESKKNLCGYCHGGVFTCNGSCFDEDYDDFLINRESHINDSIKETSQRLADLKEEKNKYKKSKLLRNSPTK